MMKKIGFKGLRPANHGVLRDINEVMVLNIIRERQPISRIAIAGLTGLEPGTVSRILQRFLASGLISEAGSGPSTPAGGRKPRYVTLNATKHCAIGVVIEPCESLLALSDFNGRIQDFRRIANTTDPETTLAAVACELGMLLQRVEAYGEFGGVGVGLAGLIDPKEGVILEAENLGWPEPVEVGKFLSARIPGVPFYFENDARLSAMGEIWFGGAQFSGIRDLVFVKIGVGVGTGIIIDGQLYRGHRNGAGEFGHVCIDPKGPHCSSGCCGCLESFTSDQATVERYLRTSGTAQAPTIDVRLIVDLANQGDDYAAATLHETAHYLGLGLAPIIYGLSPEVIVIGGALTRAWGLIGDTVRKACAERVSKPYLNNVKLAASTMQNNPSLMGAISMVLAQNFAAPEIFAAN